MSKVKKKEVSQNPKELKDYLSHVIDNNKYLQKKGEYPVAICITGGAGIGKTSIVEQVATSKGLDYVKLNLAQIGEEVSELVGYPIRQFEMENETEKIWVDEPMVESYREKGYHTTGKNQTGYCPPPWIARINGKGGIFNLDDFNRGSVRTLQAVMEIVDRQSYISWKLPPGWTVVLTRNPSDGDYMVNEIDEAQETRFINSNLKFDIDCWAQYAEELELDGRCINFLIRHSELVSEGCNPRSIMKFFNSISSIPDFSKQLPLIQMVGEGSVGIEFSSMFTTFINNKLDLIIAPHVMLTGDWKKVKEEVINCIGGTKSGKYRADIASVLCTRLINYTQLYAQTNKIDKAILERITAFITEDLFADDLKYNLIKRIINSPENKAKWAGIMLNEKVAKMALK